MISKKKISDFYCEHNRELFNYLVRLSRDADLSEDLLQESFERFIDYSIDHDIDEKTLRPLLFRIAHNLYVNHCVRQSKRHTLNIDSQTELAGKPDYTQEKISADELEQRISLFRNSLPDFDRCVFTMHKEEGKTYDEIAECTGISSRTARRKVRSVLESLSLVLTEEGYLGM
jgi:RNA polymerase sigma-70 factor (ECF subfamily)